jgi:hypothetical protein
MHQLIFLSTLLLGLATLTACREQATQAEVDMQALRQAVIKQTERIYWIHLRLDTASKAVSEAELKVRDSECSGVGYLTGEAYRNLEQADEALLELGRELQELFDLDL